MDLQKIFEKLDAYFGAKDMAGAGKYLETTFQEATVREDTQCQLALANELIGYYRDMADFEKSFAYCRTAYNIACGSDFMGTNEYATTLLNIANAYRAGGELTAAENFYSIVFELYTQLLPEDDMRFAGLHNNIALLYMEKKEYAATCEHLEAALMITSVNPDAYLEAAISHANLASVMLKSGEELTILMSHAEDAVKIFEAYDAQDDYHYSAALSTLAEAKYHTGGFNEAAQLFIRAAAAREKFMGRDEVYKGMVRSAMKSYEDFGKHDKAKALEAML
ncbi:MAG: tetratricopeptide repeat protein [Lachnospiraceae bacterium]|nr:tetratricopeptide repeat protein [Lachnospiraceae bacterium]